MTSKVITHKQDILPYVKKGMNSVADIVGRTLGPGGLPIIIKREGQSANGDPLGPMITKDGVTVAGECGSADPLEDVIIQAVKDICRKTNRVAGDGTTTAIVLGRALLNETLAVLEANPGLNPQLVRRQVETAVDAVVAALVNETTECKSFEMIEHVATISANGDQEIGNVIRRAFEAVGAEGIVTVDEGGSRFHTLEIVDGYQIKRGAEAQDRFFNNTERNKFEAENCHVVMYDGKLNQPTQVLQILDSIFKHYEGKMPPVLFMANEFSNEVLQVLLINKAEGALSTCAVRSPHQTKVTTVMLDDMAVYLGGERLGNGNRNLNNINFDDVGICQKVVVDKYSCTFYGGAGTEENVKVRIEQLKAQRENAESPYDASIISDRIAALAEGIAKIGVGGMTDLEVKEKYHRIEDAINASRAAIEEGVIPGGGATLYRYASELFLTVETLHSSTDLDYGKLIVSRALKSPFETIMSNIGTGRDVIETIGSELLKDSNSTYDGVGYKQVNAIEAGIIDPVKVTKTALRNACSIAALLATCGGALTYAKE